MKTKECKRCKQQVSVDKFGKKSSTKDGLQNWCYDCHRIYRREYRKSKNGQGGSTEYCIYALVDPDTKEVRYIGRTGQLHTRLVGHLNDAKRETTAKDIWIQSLLCQGKKPEMIVIEDVSKENMQEKEMYWILHYASQGHDLVNGLKDMQRVRSLSGYRRFFLYYMSTERLQAIRQLQIKLREKDNSITVGMILDKALEALEEKLNL